MFGAYRDVTFTAAPGGEAIPTSPTNGQNIVGARPLTWTTVGTAEGYYLTIGSTAGDYDLLDSGVLPASQTSYNALTLPVGKTLSTRIYTELDSSFVRYQDVAFQVTYLSLVALTVTGNRIPATGKPSLPRDQPRHARMGLGQLGWLRR